MPKASASASGKSKLSHKEVIDYLKGLEPEFRELVLDMAAKEIKEHEAKREVLGERLAKARKAKGKKQRGQQQAETEQNNGDLPQADPEAQRDIEASLGAGAGGGR